MARYSISTEHFGPHEVRRLSDSRSGAQALIARRGATLLRWDASVNGGIRTVSDGHRTPAELEAQSGMRFGLMAPFSNRIADGRYRFDGEAFDLQPGLAGTDRGIRHGFVRHADFDVTAEIADDEKACVRLSTRILRPGAFPGYPFAIDIALTLSLRGNSIEYRIDAANVGSRPAPYGCGLHPYFKLAPEGIEALRLQVAARTLVRTDAALIPLAGQAAYAAVAGYPELDYRQPRPIDGRVIDNAYADLQPDADGIVRTRLHDPAGGLQLIVWQEQGLLHAFTADTVARDKRASMALEPVEFPTNAFNREECASALRLEPGQSRSFRCGFEIAD